MANPQGTATLATSYTLLQDNSPGTHVWNNATGAFVLWSNATYQTWLNSTAPVQQAILISAANNGGLVRLQHDGSFTFTTGQVYRVFGTNSGVYDGIWTLTVNDGTHVTLQGSTFSVGIAQGGLWGPPSYATTATFFQVVDGYNQAINTNTRGLNVINSAVDVVLANPVKSFQRVTMTAAGKKVQMPNAGLVGGIPLGVPIWFLNEGANSFTVTDSSGGSINSLGPGDLGFITLVSNNTISVPAGLWRAPFAVAIADPTAANHMVASSGGIWLEQPVIGDVSLNAGGGLNTFTVTGINGTANVAPTSFSPTDQSGAGLTLTSTMAYTKLGNMVFVYGTLVYPATANGSQAVISLPVAVPNSDHGYAPSLIFGLGTGFPVALVALKNSSTASFWNANSNAAVTNTNLSGATLRIMLIYPAS